MTKFKKFTAAILSAVMLAISAFAVNAGAEGIPDEEIQSGNYVLLNNGKTVNADQGGLMGSQTKYYINPGKTGNVEIELNIKGGSKDDIRVHLSRSYSYPAWCCEAGMITIDSKEYSSSQINIIDKSPNEEDPRNIYGIKTAEVTIDYDEYFPHDYFVLINDGKDHTIKFTYNNIEAGNYLVECWKIGESGKATFKVNYSQGAVKVYAPAKTKLSASANKNKLTLSWDKVSGAEKYQVCCSTDGGKTYKALKELTKTSATITLKKGSSYKFAVRSYKTVNGKKVYSKFSNVKSVKY